MLSENLRKARERSGLSLEKVAKHVGATRASVHGWETGAYKPAEAFLERLAKLYGTSPPELRYTEAELAEGVKNFRELAGQKDEPPRVALGIPQRIRVWIQQFLLELVTAGVSEDEVDRVRRILSADEMFRFYAGGEPKEYSEDETLEGIQAHAEAFRREFRRRGYKIPK